MNIVIDASALLAVLLNEREREDIIEHTSGKVLMAPGSLTWEIGNALSAMFKRNRINQEQATTVLRNFHSIPIRLVDVNLDEAIIIATTLRIYAYDAYFLECAKRFNTKLLTLDQGLAKAAQTYHIGLIKPEEPRS
jgi:predicted nucleic acid-binding protein